MIKKISLPVLLLLQQSAQAVAITTEAVPRTQSNDESLDWNLLGDQRDDMETPEDAENSQSFGQMDISESPADAMADPEFDESKVEAMDQTASPADAMEATGSGASLSLVEAHDDTDEMEAGQTHNQAAEESLASEMNAPATTNEVDLMQTASLAQGASTEDDMNDAASAAGASEEGMAADDSLAALEDLEVDQAERHPADAFDGDSAGAHAQAAHADKPQADKEGHEEPQDEGDDAADDEPIPDEEEASPPASLTQLKGDEECSGTKCAGYRGMQTKTRSGRQC